MKTNCPALHGAMADNFMFYLEAHFFHWNVEGPTFSQLHDLFGKIYEDADGAMDGLAEQIRALGEYAPATPGELIDGARIVIAPTSEAEMMVAKLAADNEILIGSLTEAMTESEEIGAPGLTNYLQDRIDRQAKWGWMLKATADPEGGKMEKSKVLHDHPRSR